MTEMNENCVIKIENLSKEYRLGAIGSGTLRHDLQSWYAKKRGKEDPNQRIGAKQYTKGDTFLALDGVNLEVNRGERIGIIGANGAGKSTTLNAIAGVWPVDCGQILIDGKDISALPEHKRAPYLGRVFQDPMTGTVADMEIIENLAIAARRGKKRGLSWGVKADERFRYRQMLAEFDLGLEDRMSSKVGLLSGGQRQAITLLMATIKKPKLLLLDEHTAALDPKTAAKVLELSDKIIAENNLTALMVTHNMHDAITHGNRLIMMSDGKIILDISGEEKKNLTVEHLLEMFEKASGSKLENDRMLLSKDK